jgi:GTP-binding protein
MCGKIRLRRKTLKVIPTTPWELSRDVRLHFAFERFLVNQIRAAFGFIGAPSGSNSARNKKPPEE